MSFQPFTPNPNADDPFNSYPAMSTGVADEFGLPFFSPDDFSKEREVATVLRGGCSVSSGGIRAERDDRTAPGCSQQRSSDSPKRECEVAGREYEMETAVPDDAVPEAAGGRAFLGRVAPVGLRVEAARAGEPPPEDGRPRGSRAAGSDRERCRGQRVVTRAVVAMLIRSLPAVHCPALRDVFAIAHVPPSCRSHHLPSASPRSFHRRRRRVRKPPRRG
ncbi:hypothetical protein DM02DRAFT_734575 [Periconia macrospinosa]|uniref:Uncharacterized protein n=1 Tax=Periconia macrospinosa TaxID=97972 RepID=A0A2V1CXI0_9PLEO|nr:hypothetical protein DM02DRAFT_734575 [Periconia macrospinosa]